VANLTALRLILGFSIVSTALHYTHNFVAVEDYPGSGAGIQIAIVVSWPLLTAIGLYGYRLYAAGRFREAYICLLLYAPLGLLTPAHFLSGEPNVPTVFYVTIFTDGLAGLAVVGFVVWSAAGGAGAARPRSSSSGRRFRPGMSAPGPGRRPG
jgi:hypothetical protein